MMNIDMIYKFLLYLVFDFFHGLFVWNHDFCESLVSVFCGLWALSNLEFGLDLTLIRFDFFVLKYLWF